MAFAWADVVFLAFRRKSKLRGIRVGQSSDSPRRRHFFVLLQKEFRARVSPCAFREPPGFIGFAISVSEALHAAILELPEKQWKARTGSLRETFRNRS